jgi:hypothetical protein
MMGLAAAATIGLDFLLIPTHYEMGAAYAIVGGELVLMIATWIGARKFGSEFR